MSAVKERKKAAKAVESFSITIPAKSSNESFARAVAAAFAARLDPTVEELADIKTAVSEAVTNCVVHAYKNSRGKGDIRIKGSIYPDRRVVFEIKDRGCGMEDVAKCLQPLYTGDPEGERSGMGFTVMESFCDGLKVRSQAGKGTTVVLTKCLGGDTYE